ncbi:FUSC family protein [Oleiagrimonas sp. C23AA]|uniref:FUSC family protein n=1 Tax=Oleiagrimonas sp. C23AA TaxID=2719047 RepID=UPI00142265E6|nr:FUSC family protein [Oleiagrimonas sp. C23AA]NII09344.1 FUSC family protein [Oleiagrimonas sp. C23AA]
MAAGSYSLRTAFLTSLTQFKRPDVPLRVALRNTLAVVLPLALGFASGHAEVGVGLGAGALNVMFSDQPGPYRQRLLMIGLASLAGALSGLVGFLIGTHSLWLLPVVMIWSFLGGLLVLFGPNIARVGMISVILLVIAAAEPLAGTRALGASALILGGGLLQAVLAIMAWPLQRYRPERHALARVYEDLATMARQRPGDGDAPPLTESMTELQQTLLGRSGRGRAMEAFVVLLELAERMRLELLAMADIGPHQTRTRQRVDLAVARVLLGIAKALTEAEPPHHAERALERLKRLEAGNAQQLPRPLGRHLHTLIGQLGAAVRNSRWAGSRGELRASAAERRLPKALRMTSAQATVRANLHLQSSAFRHALRCAVCVGLALITGRILQLPHGYWMPMTAAIVLRPDFGATFSFGLLRVVGTIGGLLLTTAMLALSPHDVWAHLALMALLCFAFRYLATAHYGVGVAALTGTVVILLAFEGVPSGEAVVDRALNTVLGSIAALTAYLVWPTWERRRIRVVLAEMLRAYADYLATLAAPDPAEERREARTAARAARSQAEASLGKLRNEPGTPPRTLELAQSLLANGNRLVRTAMHLEALHQEADEVPWHPATQAFIDACVEATRELANALVDGHAANLPDLRSRQRKLARTLHDDEALDDDEHIGTLRGLCDRLTDNINTLGHVLARSHAPDTADSPLPASQAVH